LSAVRHPVESHEGTMNPPVDPPPILHTTAGDFPLGECRLAVGGRQWSVVSTTSVVTRDDEARYLANQADQLPYGVALWPAAIALAHEIATRSDEFRGKRVLELGAGTGLPEIVAASLGAAVVQTDRNELALHICRLNGSMANGTGRLGSSIGSLIGPRGTTTGNTTG
jgi:hypothetical protein